DVLYSPWGLGGISLRGSRFEAAIRATSSSSRCLSPGSNSSLALPCGSWDPGHEARNDCNRFLALGLACQPPFQRLGNAVERAKAACDECILPAAANDQGR